MLSSLTVPLRPNRPRSPDLPRDLGAVPHPRLLSQQHREQHLDVLAAGQSRGADQLALAPRRHRRGDRLAAVQDTGQMVRGRGVALDEGGGAAEPAIQAVVGAVLESLSVEEGAQERAQASEAWEEAGEAGAEEDREEGAERSGL